MISDFISPPERQSPPSLIDYEVLSHDVTNVSTSRGWIGHYCFISHLRYIPNQVISDFIHLLMFIILTSMALVHNANQETGLVIRQVRNGWQIDTQVNIY